MDQPICRTCLSTSDGSIFKTVFLDQKELSLVEMLNECTGIKVIESDEISLNICDICTEEIIKSYIYRKKCWESHNFLIQRLEEDKIVRDPIKCEAASDSEEMYEVVQLLLSDTEEGEPNETVPKKSEPIVHYINLDKAPKGRGATQCQLCDKIYYRRNLILEHLRNVHNILEYHKFECDICQKSFLRLSSLRRHILNVHEQSESEDSTKFMCHHCGRKLKCQRDFLEHVRGHTGETPYKCDSEDCKKSFPRLSSLRRHILNVHEQPDREDVAKFMCHHCGQKLKNRQNFIEHVRRHTGEKPYKCNLCEYRAAQRTSINIHMRTHTGERPFECDVCGKQFRTSSGRSTHRQGHSDETPYECIVCLKKFKKKDIYKEHMVIHDPDKHIECTFCGKKFARKDNLNTHIKQHTGEKPHVCEVCGKGFIQKHCWQNHMTNHHKQ